MFFISAFSYIAQIQFGSILGPTLFYVYINGVALAAGDSPIHLYADDAILYTSGPSLDTMLTNLKLSLTRIEIGVGGLGVLPTSRSCLFTVYDETGVLRLLFNEAAS